MITPAQIRAARAMANMKQADLASAASVSLATLNNIERGVTDPRQSTVAAIQSALEAAGVRFIEPNGVQLTKAQHDTISRSAVEDIILRAMNTPDRDK